MLPPKIIFSFLLLLFAQISIAQCRLQGHVSDVLFNETLPGVHVTVRGTTVRSVTGRNGDFSINLPCSQKAVLDFEVIGYFNKSMSIADNVAKIEIALDENPFEWADMMIPINSIVKASFHLAK